MLRSRYMDTIFRGSAALLFLNLCSIVWRTTASTTAAADDILHVPVVDACAMLRDELGWFAPACLVVAAMAFVMRRSKAVYLVDFELYKAPSEWRSSKEELLTMLRNAGAKEKSFTEEDLAFMSKVLGNSGTVRPGDRGHLIACRACLSCCLVASQATHALTTLIA